MKAFDTGLKTGALYVSQNGEANRVTTGPFYQDKLTASPLVKGDRKRPLAHSYTASTVYYPKGKNDWIFVYTNGSRGYKLRGGCIGWGSSHPFLNGVTFPAGLRARILDKLSEKVRGSLDLSVDLAQIGKTARMFTATENARLFAQTFRGWRGLIKGVSDARLAFAYGWKPLAGSIYGVLDETLNHVLSELTTVRVKATEPIGSSLEKFTFENYGDLYATCEREGRYTTELCVVMKTKSHDPARWSSLNPASIAWELLPYSFVVDWVLDVGGYLRNLETSLLYANSFVQGYRSEGMFFDGKWSGSSSRADGYNPRNTYSVDAHASYRHRQFTRSVLSSYPVPRLPSFEVDLGTGRLFNLAALLGSKMRVR